ncbi:sensor histidine kinase, partial [Planctomycetota bacterium]
GQLVAIHLCYEMDLPLNESYLRAVMFLVVAFVVGLLSERYTESQEQISDYEAELRSLASELSLAEEREKHRIAVELHDHFGQELALFRLRLDDMKNASLSADLTEQLDRLSARLKQTIKSLRSLTFDLSSSTLFELGFEKAVTEWLSERIEQEQGIATEFSSEGQWESLDENISVILFQTVRELLVNVVKHARASLVKVSIMNNGEEIRVVVQDNGVGFNPNEEGVKTKTSGGLGLFSIRERMGYLGGKIEFESQRNQGSRISLILPLKPDRQKLGW